ncbi:MAG: ABC transporter permease [Candidatus Dormiibacterota bacterium]
MSSQALVTPQPRARVSVWGAGLRKALRQPGAVVGGGILVVEVLLAIFAPLVAQHDPLHTYANFVQAAPSRQFPFGTDQLGRDVFARVVYGTRISLEIAIICVVIALSCGSFLGLVAGFVGGAVDSVIMRVMDVLLAFPDILLAIAIVAILGPSLNNTIVAIGIAVIPVYARTVRSAVLSVRQADYVKAARVAGVSGPRIVLRHVLPNVAAPIIVISTVNSGVTILAAAGLSYLGLGAQPPTAEWGSMLSTALDYMPTGWWMAVFPGLAITLTVLAFNLLGDALRDLLDPRFLVD